MNERMAGSMLFDAGSYAQWMYGSMNDVGAKAASDFQPPAKHVALIVDWATALTDPLSAGPSTNCSTTGNELLDYYGYNLAMGTIVGALIGFYVIFHIGSYLSLSYLYKKR